MKQFFIYLAALLFGAALFSCANEAAVSSDDYRPKSIKLVFDVSPFGAVDENDIDTKTHVTPINNYAGYKFYWSANDTVGIFPSGGSQIYFRVDSDGEASGADFDGGAWEPRAGYTFHGYFPFIGNYYLDATKIPVSFLGQKQEGNANSDHFQNYDFMCTPTTSYDEELQDFRFSFKHLITGVLPWVEVPAGHYVGLDLSLDEPLFVTEGEYDLTAENPAIIGKKFTKDFHIDLDITFEQTETLIAYVPLAPLNIAGKTLTITITDESGTNYSYTYSPSRAYVASNIYRLRSSVSFAIGSVSVDPTELNLYVDQTQQLTATVLPENYTNKSVTWSSSDPAVATVNESGEVTAVSVGSATITVTTVEGGLTATSTVIVRPAPINFADPAVKEICVENWDTDGDGELSYEEAAAVTTISTLFCENEAITSFDEFQFFTGVSSIKNGAFENCSSLSSITIPENVTTIELAAFFNCSSLTEIVMPDHVISLGLQAFRGCSNLTTVVFSSDLESIGQQAFFGCSSLKDFELPYGLKTIGIDAFYRCSSLTGLEIPDTVTSIGNSAFTSCSSLSNVILPSNLTSIEDQVFLDCPNLAIIDIPDGLKTIGADSFGSCFSLTNIDLPEELSTIGRNAFIGCGLTSIVLPEGLISIGDNAFYSCTKLASIQVNALTPPAGGSEMFSQTNNCPIYVPAASVKTYKTAEYWINYADRIQAIPGSVIEVSGVSLNNSTLSLTVGASETLTATVSPDDATNKTVSWSTSDSGVASVSNGLVTAVGVGTATITVTTEDGGKTATCAVTVNPVEVTSVTLDQDTLSLTKGGTATLVATVNPATATDKTVTWSSNNTEVATVDANGKVTAVGGGSATITATAGGKSATCDVTVTVPVTGVSLNKTTLTLSVNATETLTATVNPSDASNKNFTWSSSNTAVATVVNGSVTAVGVGTATITVTTEDGGKTATCAVMVNPVEVTSVTLDQNTLSLTKGGTATLVAAVNPATATDKTVTWSSNNIEVATVDANGKVTAVGGGSATITATAGGKTATCAVTVTVPVTGVSLNKTTLTLSMNATETLTATVNPSDASNKNITWSSSNTSVATVANGVVTAVSAGTAIITVTTEDGGKTATCSVTVNPVSGGNEGVIGGVVD
ncbi:MAG: Ig-like domain-containing protein [Bacteroidales bacterium]|nr:Ig-like domain-containing protein [Bacteroidales bacterium]